jgi:long-chain acyl-CoA synthetase
MIAESNPTTNFFGHLLQNSDHPILIIDGKEISKANFISSIELRRRQIINYQSKLNTPVPVVSYRGWRYWVDILALWATNKIPVPIDPTMPIKNIQYIVDAINAEFSLGETNTGLLSLDEIDIPNLHSKGDSNQIFSIDEDNIAAILFTSGSTGLPKGVVLKFKALMGNAFATACHLKMNENRLVISIPFHFTSAISHFLASVISSSTLIASEEKLLPAQLVALVNQSKADCFGGSPLQLDWLAKSSTHIKTDLKWIMSSGDHLSVATINLLRCNLSKCKVHTCYGLTEVAGRCCFLNPEELKNHSGSVGMPINGLKIKVLDENGSLCANELIGEIYVEGDYLMEEYFQAPEITATALSEKGFATGDLGYFSEQGFLYLTARKDDVFKVNGQKVSVIPIQQQILALGKVNDIAVIPYQHSLLGKVPIAFYVSKEDQPLNIRELILLLRKTLPGNHIPQEFIELKSIPRTASGKIKRSVLLDHAAQQYETTPEESD